MVTPFTVISGAAAAAFVAIAAQRGGMLAWSGAAAAALLGWMAMLAGPSWAILLLTYFTATSLLSRWQRVRKTARTSGIVEKGGSRDAWQVVANGGVFAVAALGSVMGNGSLTWMALGAGALAASAADSWGTEVGTLALAAPRSILTGRSVPVGTSGGVTWVGLVASLGGAAFVSLVCRAAGYPTAIARAVLVGGVAGALADSVIGAALQGRRWCEPCGMETEQRRHRCGTPTAHWRGIPWLTNDGVNLVATMVGFAVALSMMLAL